jgi:hypothetical protein
MVGGEVMAAARRGGNKCEHGGEEGGRGRWKVAVVRK